MTPASWPCPLPTGGFVQEYALVCDRQRPQRLLIVPALFDESNKLRRLTVEVMRRLDAHGVDCFLPDLPGCNESLQPLNRQTPAAWLDAVTAVARHFGATHALGIRGGCLFTPASLPCWHYAPVKAASILRQMMRARILASREAGREEFREDLAATAHRQGIELAGYPLGADFYRDFETMLPDPSATLIAQEDVGGSSLWLRAEPDEDPSQSHALARILREAIGDAVHVLRRQAHHRAAGRIEGEGVGVRQADLNRGFGRRLFRLALGVTKFLVQQIDLFLHDLVAVLQRTHHRLLLDELFSQRLVFRAKGGIIRFAARRQRNQQHAQ